AHRLRLRMGQPQQLHRSVHRHRRNDPGSLPGPRSDTARTRRTPVMVGLRTGSRHNGGMDAEAWNERYRARELVWSAGPNQFVEAELSELPTGRALDLACGEGRNAIWLAQRGWQVTAVDFAEAGLDKGRQLSEGLDIDWARADATTWHDPTGQ